MVDFKKLILILGIIISFQPMSFSQVKFSESFAATLNQMDLDIAIPVERSYRNKQVQKKSFFNSALTIRSRKKKIEIQYALFPDHQFLVPNVQTTSTLASLASNEEIYATIAIHKIKEEDLSEAFNADWGSLVYFQPKRSFSRFRYGKLLSLYKKGRGLIYVLFLFDEADEDLENQFYSVRFRDVE
ncbi:MAG: hypothetical protein ACI8VT_002656 [Saprospiraceae bacterium]|jgi:hypothetical protein